MVNVICVVELGNRSNDASKAREEKQMVAQQKRNMSRPIESKQTGEALLHLIKIQIFTHRDLVKRQAKCNVKMVCV